MCTTQDLSFASSVNTTDICPGLLIPAELGLQYTSSETSIPMVNVTAVGFTDPCEPLPPEADDEFVNRMKARNRRRLQERWNCQASGHTYCFLTLDGAHIPLNEESIEAWVSSLNDCTATLLVPPKCIVQSTPPPAQSDAASARTTRSSGRTIEYQRPFRLGNFSLTDLRSMRIRLRDSISSTSVSWSSIASSGVPGIGYLSGKAIKWVGMQILNGTVPLEIRRRRRVIRELVRRMDAIPIADRAAWVVRNERKISHAIENLLELSSENYKTDYQITAIKQGILIHTLIRDTFLFRSDELAILSSMHAKLLPLNLLAENDRAAENLAGDLREILLQDSAPADEELLVAEMATSLCIELTDGTSSPWRAHGYDTLWYLYQTPFGKQHLQYLETCGVLMDDLAKRAFEISPNFICTDISSGQQDIFEQRAAVCFFAVYANDCFRFRDYISRAGIPFLVQAIKSVEDGPFGSNGWWDIVRHVCRTLADLSILDWCIPIFARLDVCPTLVKLLIANHRITDVVENPVNPWVAYDIISFLRHVSLVGGDEGTRVVRDAVTDELRQILPNVGESVRIVLGDVVARRVESCISELGV